MKIGEYFEKDHDRLDDLFYKFQEWKRKDYPKAREYFVAFKFGLQRHIIWEEEILFPLFEKKTTMTQEGPTFVMRMEHRQIGQRLEAIHSKVKAADPESEIEEESLLEILTTHNMKEEGIIYPTIDHFANEFDVKETFDRMNAMPEERYQFCCQSAIQIAGPVD